MKKLLIIACAFTLMFGACKKNDSSDTGSGGSTTLTVQKVNKAMLFDFSETWCPPCGAYGGPSFDSCLVGMEISKISLMKVYGSSTPSTFNAAISNAMGNSFNVSGVPTFFVNEQELASGGGVYSNIGANYNWVKQKAEAFAAGTVNAGVALSKSISGTTMTVKTKVKFYVAQPATKNLKLAVYVVEDHLIASQSVSGSGTVTNYEHRNLLRDCNAADYTGVDLNAGVAVTVDQEFSKDFTFTLNSTWKTANLKVIAVIWDATSGKAKLINSNMVK